MLSIPNSLASRIGPALLFLPLFVGALASGAFIAKTMASDIDDIVVLATFISVTSAFMAALGVMIYIALRVKIEGDAIYNHLAKSYDEVRPHRRLQYYYLIRYGADYKRVTVARISETRTATHYAVVLLD